MGHRADVGLLTEIEIDLQVSAYKNLATFWQDYFLGTGKIFLEILLILKKSCQILPKQNLANLKSILSNIILNNFSLRIF